jgi:hypothetical protein
LDMVISAKTTFGSPIFRDLIITTCWIIWKTRNGVSFDGEDYNLCRWKFSFKEELGLVCIKAMQDTKVQLELWRENFSWNISFSLFRALKDALYLVHIVTLLVQYYR